MRLIKLSLTAIISVGIVFSSIPKVYADETSELILKLLIEKGVITQKEVDGLKAEIAKEKPKVPKGIEERVAVLEEKTEEKGFLSIKGADFQLAGELEYEFVDTEGDGSDDEPHFQLDKLVLQPKVKIGDNLKMDAQLYYQDGSVSFNEIHAKFYGFPLKSWIDVGLYERWLKGHHGRKTEGYALLGTAFYRDDALTATLGGEYEPLYWMFSIANGYEIDEKQVAEDSASTSKIIHDDHATSGLTDSFELGANIGLKHDFKEAGKVDLIAFYYNDELSRADRSSLQSNLSGYVSNNDDKSRYGAGIKYMLGDATLYGAYIEAEDGELDRDTWLAEASYHFKLGTTRKWFTGIEPLVSYSDYDVENTKNTSSPWSWDREKWMFASIIDLYEDTKLKLEYYINDEKTGGGDVDNDELLVQLEVKF